VEVNQINREESGTRHEC